VSSLPFAEGQPVAKGALIAQLDDREIRAAAEHAEAQREWSQSNADRAQKLFDQQLASQQQLDDARTNLKVAQADEALAKARLAKTRIRAPFSGMIGRRRVSPGAYLKAGDVITELARVDAMKVTFTAPERYLAQLRSGSKVEASTPALPGRAFQGSISVVDPIVDPDSRTIRVVARIPNSERMLRPGMSANVAVTFSERPNSLVIPDEAVFAEGNQSFVYVVKPDSTVARVAIELGSRDSARVEVLRGLEVGATIVRTGHQKLFDGAHVMPIPEQAMTAEAGAPSGPPGARAGATAPAGGKAAAGGSKSGAPRSGSPKGGGAPGSPGGTR
jgi:membrane fusion protein (multidrug efflux system)